MYVEHSSDNQVRVSTEITWASKVDLVLKPSSLNYQRKVSMDLMLTEFTWLPKDSLFRVSIN